MMKSFRYSGNKARLLKAYRRPPPGVERVVEPYLGSGAYVLSTGLPGLGYETNGDIVELWRWLQQCRPDDLRDLRRDVERFTLDGGKDVREMNLSKGPETYVRVNVTGLLTGQLTAWRIYPQHRLPIEETIAALDAVRRVQVIHAPSAEYVPSPGDMAFVDPPYHGTRPGYEEKGLRSHDRHDVTSVEAVLNACDVARIPSIMTYGDGAAEVFPGRTWELVTTRKVPNVRSGGCVERREHVSYSCWPSSLSGADRNAMTFV